MFEVMSAEREHWGRQDFSIVLKLCLLGTVKLAEPCSVASGLAAEVISYSIAAKYDGS